MKTYRSILYLSALFVVTNCSQGGSSSSTSSTYSASQPSKVMGGVGTGLTAAGSSTGKTSLGSNAVASLNPKELPKNLFSVLIPKAFAAGEGVSGRCDSHGYPLVTGTSTRMNSSQADYGAMSFFCRLAKDTGDSESVLGSYSLMKAIACAVENAGITWDNAQHNITVNIDTTCFSSAQVTSIGASSMTITVQAAKPAPFNSYYDAGAILTIPSFGTYRLGAKVSGNLIEFGGSEDQSSITAHKWGAYFGQYNQSTGDLRFESRSDRFGAPMSGGSSCGSSCGFGFHMRLYAKLGFDSNSNPTNISTVSGAIASIGRQDDSYNSMSSELITASGDLTGNGVKIRHYSLSGLSGSSNISKFSDPTQYTENSSAEGCYTSSSNAANTCGTGITIGSSTLSFMQVGTIASGATGYTDAITWLNNISSAPSFTSVTLTDSQ